MTKYKYQNAGITMLLLNDTEIFKLQNYLKVSKYNYSLFLFALLLLGGFFSQLFIPFRTYPTFRPVPQNRSKKSYNLNTVASHSKHGQDILFWWMCTQFSQLSLIVTYTECYNEYTCQADNWAIPAVIYPYTWLMGCR